MIPGVGGKFGRIIKRRERNRKTKGKKWEKRTQVDGVMWRGRENSRTDDDVGNIG